MYSSSQKLCHTATGNSHAIWDHTVLPATRQRWESRLYPQPKQVLDLATWRDARLSWPMLRESRPAENWTATCKSLFQRPTTEPPRNTVVVWGERDVYPLTSGGVDKSLLGPNRVSPPNGISIISAVFAGHIRATNTQTTDTDHATCNICSNGPHLYNAYDAASDAAMAASSEISRYFIITHSRKLDDNPLGFSWQHQEKTFLILSRSGFRSVQKRRNERQRQMQQVAQLWLTNPRRAARRAASRQTAKF